VTDRPGDAHAAGTARVAAVIDIGSNSVLLLTVAVEPDGSGRVLDEALVTTQLGSGLLPGGALAPAARTRTCAAVVALTGRARARGARRVWGFATGAARDAADGAEFAREVAAASGIPVAVLSGEEEATLAWGAVRAGLDLGGASLLVADVGGRTTELTLGTGDAAVGSASLSLGALALTDAHGANLAAICAAVDVALAGCDLPARAQAYGARLAASGGTATALAALDLGLARYDPDRVHGHVLLATTLGALVARLAAMPAAARAALPALDPGRAAILPAGAAVLDRLAAAAGVRAITVSDHGVRHAYLRRALAAEGLRVVLGGSRP